MAYIYGKLFNHKEESSYVVFRNTDATGNRHAEQIKSVSEKKILDFFTFVLYRFYKNMKLSRETKEKERKTITPYFLILIILLYTLKLYLGCISI